MKFPYILALLVLCAVTVPTHSVQFAGIFCDFNVTTGEVTANMFIYKNGSDITRAYFMVGTDTIFEENPNPGCAWTGDGSDQDPFINTVYFNYQDGMPSAGQADCTARESEAGVEYYWLVHSQIASPVLQKGDIIFKFICNVNYRLIDSASVNGTVQVYDLNADIAPVGGLMELEVIDPDTETELSFIELGGDFRLQLTFQPSGGNQPNTDDELRPWGAFCQRLYASPPDGSIQFDVFDNNLCPRDDVAFLRPDTGFIGGPPDVNDQFTAITGEIEAARFDLKGSESVFFVCDAKLCWRPNDLDCLNPCLARTVGGRKRRELIRRVSAELVIKDRKVQTDTKTGSDDSGGIPVYVWAAIGVGAAILALIIVICTIFALKRTHSEKYRHQEDSFTSSHSSSYSRNPKSMYI